MADKWVEGRLTSYVSVECKDAFAQVCQDLGFSVSARIGQLVRRDIEKHRISKARKAAAAKYDGVPGL